MHLMAPLSVQNFTPFRHARPCDINFDTSVMMLLKYDTNRIGLSCVLLSSHMSDKEIQDPEINHMIAHVWETSLHAYIVTPMMYRNTQDEHRVYVCSRAPSLAAERILEHSQLGLPDRQALAPLWYHTPLVLLQTTHAAFLRE